MSDTLGRVRRSQVVMLNGPGAIIDFRAGRHGGAAVSVVAAGLDEWDRMAPPVGLMNPQRVSEPRLEKKLNVRGFRLPPVNEPPLLGREPDPNRPVLPAVRFPEWLTCPSCNFIQPIRRWSEDEDDPAPYCALCSDREGHRVHVVPARFILACEHGHIDEFPWREWLDHTPTCSRRNPLKLEGVGAGLKGLVLTCTGCGARRSMDGAFSPQALWDLGLRCAGRQPWLPGPPTNCGLVPHVVQRGASNLYFPATESALSIPPWDDDLQAAMGEWWVQVATASTPEDRNAVVRQYIWPIWEGPDRTLEDLQERVRQRVELHDSDAAQNLRFQEYLQLDSGRDSDDDNSELSLRNEGTPPPLRAHLSRITQVTRLREVRVLYGFSRIQPPTGGFGTASVAPISLRKKRWLPAIEVRGEGIFITLNEKRLRAWERRERVTARAAVLEARNLQVFKERLGPDAKPDLEISPRYVLIHTLAHLLMSELALECGYSTSSLRERLYVETGAPGMAGLLIYTSTSDADGTLGGLVRQARPDRIGELFRSAVDRARWCSSDPLCMSGALSFSGGLNGAACHSCTLAPETSCESFNHYLDRALVVGTPDDPDFPADEQIGLFIDLPAR
jgi:hypothetical protein